MRKCRGQTRIKLTKQRLSRLDSCAVGDVLCNLVGVSPDAKVMDKDGGICLGLAEYKAPIYKVFVSHCKASSV